MWGYLVGYKSKEELVAAGSSTVNKPKQQKNNKNKMKGRNQRRVAQDQRKVKDDQFGDDCWIKNRGPNSVDIMYMLYHGMYDEGGSMKASTAFQGGQKKPVKNALPIASVMRAGGAIVAPSCFGAGPIGHMFKSDYFSKRYYLYLEQLLGSTGGSPLEDLKRRKAKTYSPLAHKHIYAIAGSTMMSVSKGQESGFNLNQVASEYNAQSLTDEQTDKLKEYMGQRRGHEAILMPTMDMGIHKIKEKSGKSHTYGKILPILLKQQYGEGIGSLQFENVEDMTTVTHLIFKYKANGMYDAVNDHLQEKVLKGDVKAYETELKRLSEEREAYKIIAQTEYSMKAN